MKILIITKNKLPDIKNEIVKTMEVSTPEKFNSEEIKHFDGVIVDSSSTNFSVDIISKVKQATSEAVYLKPTFLLSNSEVTDKYLSMLSDGTTDVQNITGVVPTIERIAEKTSNIKEVKEEIFESSVMLKVLRYLYTRARNLQPIIMTNSKFGYTYPLVACNFPDREDHRMFEALDILERENLLNGTFVDRVHLCNKCRSTFLNFKEICIKCGSANLSAYDNIHHFVCGYVGGEPEFKVDDEFICPKCGKVLKHIGLDYDRPSAVYNCNDSKDTFQEPDVEAQCFYCGNKSLADKLIVRDIKIYDLVPAGINFAIHGLQFSLSDLLKDKLDIIDYKAFKTMLNFEAERNKRYKKESSLAFLQISNFQQLYLNFGERKDQIAMEMAKIVKDALRKSDIISSLNESTFVLLMTETPLRSAKIATGRVEGRLKELVRDNLGSFPVEISVNTVPVEENLNLERIAGIQ